jgi:hypothetical protein
MNWIFHLKISSLPKNPISYQARLLWNYRENAKWNQQFCTILDTGAPKTGKKLKLEDSIPNKYEPRLLSLNSP